MAKRNAFEYQVLHELHQIKCSLGKILQKIDNEHHVRGFKIIQLTEDMGDLVMTNPVSNILGIKAGAVGTFLALPVDDTGADINVPAGIIPVWTVSDSTLAAVTASADGLTANVSVDSAAKSGATFTLSVTATLADGKTPSGSATVPVEAGTVTKEVASFVITQTA